MLTGEKITHPCVRKFKNHLLMYAGFFFPGVSEDLLLQPKRFAASHAADHQLST